MNLRIPIRIPLAAWMMFAALWICSISGANTFGRFGFTETPDCGGIQIGKQGLRAKYSGADQLRFNSPLRLWKPLTVSNEELTVSTEGGIGRPSKIKLNLWDFGVLLYFPAGIELNISSTGSPYLSWTEGSVNDGVPTPNVDWLTLSFKDGQPPLVFGFLDERCGLIIEGSPGSFKIRSTTKYRGWVRVGLPVGLVPTPTYNAASLGRLALETKALEDVWSGPPVEVVSREIDSDDQSVTETWKFSRKTFSVPNAFYFGEIGGYPVRIQTDHERTYVETETGPFIIGKGGELQVRFPCRRIPIGRGLGVNTNPIDVKLPSGLSWSNPNSVLSVILANLTPGRPQIFGEQARTLSTSFFDLVEGTQEPLTKQSAFYSANGKGAVEVATHALLVNSTSAINGEVPDEDPQLLSLGWRMDAITARFWGAEAGLARKIGAIAAVAGAFSAAPEQRLISAKFECGLAAERGLGIDARRQGKAPANPNLPEPLFDLRSKIYSLKTSLGKYQPQDTTYVFSDLRSFGDLPVWLEKIKDETELCWMVRDKLFGIVKIESGYPVAFTSRANLQSLFQSQRIGTHELRYEPTKAGVCRVRLVQPSWARPLPVIAAPLTYSEPIL